MNPYRERVWSLLEDATRGQAAFAQVLDFGCGDGWFAHRFLETKRAAALVPLDISRRQQVWVEPQLYPGGALPFADASFDLVYSVDVLHHCPDPLAQLAELARCSRRFLLLKDHTYATQAGRLTLAVLDEIGNRRFGIPSPYHYQRRWTWHEQLLAHGWKSLAFIHPAPCHTGLLGALTNPLQYVAFYERG